MNPLRVNTQLHIDPSAFMPKVDRATLKKKLWAPQAGPRKSVEAKEAPVVAKIAERAQPARVWPVQYDSHVRVYLEAKSNEPKAFLRMKCLEIGVDFEEMISTRRSRKRVLVKPRQYLMGEVKKKFPNMSLSMVGRLFGGFDHTTVLHALHKSNVDMDEINRLKRTPQSLSPSIYRMLLAGSHAETIRALMLEGKTAREIGAAIGLGRSSICKFIRKQGWQR